MLPNSELNILCYEAKIFEDIMQWVIFIISKLKKVLSLTPPFFNFKLLSIRMRRRFLSCICLTGNVEYTGYCWLMWKNSSLTLRVHL